MDGSVANAGTGDLVGYFGDEKAATLSVRRSMGLVYRAIDSVDETIDFCCRPNASWTRPSCFSGPHCCRIPGSGRA